MMDTCFQRNRTLSQVACFNSRSCFRLTQRVTFCNLLFPVFYVVSFFGLIKFYKLLHIEPFQETLLLEKRIKLARFSKKTVIDGIHTSKISSRNSMLKYIMDRTAEFSLDLLHPVSFACLFGTVSATTTKSHSQLECKE